MVFVSEQDNIRVDNGPDFYGSKMFLDKNGGHNYVLGNAWEGNWGYSTKLPNEGRMGSISLTRKIKLLKNGNTYSLFSEMVGVNYQVTSSYQDIPSGATLSNIGDGDSFKIAIHLKNMQQYNRNVVIKIAGNQYDCDFLMNFAGNTVKGHRYNASFVNNAEFAKDRTFNVALSGKNDIWVNFYVDRTSIEIEFPDGQTYTMVKSPAGRSNESITVTADQSIKFDYEYTQLDSNSVRSVTNNTHLSTQSPVGPQDERGPVGAQGPQGPRGPQGKQGDPGNPGKDGKSAYQIWLDAGNKGTESDFINSLKGPKGDKGDPGVKGDPGAKGETGATGPAGKDGKTPIVGEDYFTDKDKQDFKDWISSQIINKPWGGN